MLYHLKLNLIKNLIQKPMRPKPSQKHKKPIKNNKKFIENTKKKPSKIPKNLKNQNQKSDFP